MRAMKRADLPDDVLTRAGFCHLAKITLKAFDGWVAGGIPIAQHSSGRGGEWWISPSQVLQWLWAHRERSATPALSLDTQRARLAGHQADARELQNAVLRGELLPASDVVAGWQAAMSRCRSLLLGIPFGAADTLLLLARSKDPEEALRLMREHLVKLIDGALTELSNTRLDPDDLDDDLPAAAE